MTEYAIRGLQCRAARAGRRLGQQDLADLAKLSRVTVAKVEEDDPGIRAGTHQLVAQAFETLGVTFREEGDSLLVIFSPDPRPKPA
jgi:transcriptional regulator with XRE-family HTH domain